MSATPSHPSWCQCPHADDDGSHRHTATVGVTYLALDAAIELVLTQAPDSEQPMLMLRVTAPTALLSIDITGAQAWALAGLLIDATVAHAHAVPHRPAALPARPSVPPSSSLVDVRPRPVWLLDRHPNGRMPAGRTGRRWFRCGQNRPRSGLAGT